VLLAVSPLTTRSCSMPTSPLIDAFRPLIESAPSGLDAVELCLDGLLVLSAGEPVRFSVPLHNEQDLIAGPEQAGTDVSVLRFPVGSRFGTLWSTQAGATRLLVVSSDLQLFLSAVWVGQQGLLVRGQQLAESRKATDLLDRATRRLADLLTVEALEEHVPRLVADLFDLPWVALYRGVRESTYEARFYHTTDGARLPDAISKAVLDDAVPVGAAAFLTASLQDILPLFPPQAKVAGFLDHDGTHAGLLLLGDRPGGWHARDLERVDTLRVMLGAAYARALEITALTARSTTDGLTQLHNRAFFDRQLEHEVDRALKVRQSVALIMCDIDKFKTFNDTYGHDLGDRVLRSVCDTIQSVLRAPDFACRYGGEEIALILPSTDLAGAQLVAERVRAAVEASEVAGPGGQALRVTISLGVGVCPLHSRTRGQLQGLADAALFEAKRKGRNQTAIAAR
jgi:diguanylate cyclase (GGDEF)-like protein